MGAIGLLSAATFDSARSYALAAGAIFAVVAVWGFLDGTDVAGLLVADTTNNVTHAVLGLLVAAMPRRAQIPSEPTDQDGRTADREPRRLESDRRSTPDRITGPR
jgi:Domain of unknown function (DUF4383)